MFRWQLEGVSERLGDLRGRRGVETMGLSAISIAAVVAVRYPGESHGLLILELCVIAAVAGWQCFGRSAHLLTSAAILATPVILAVVARIIQTPSPPEMTGLMMLGTASLALASGSSRHRSMPLVASGFLTLFAVTISDSPMAVGWAVAWMALCVWHLVANHWERLETCAVQQVRRGAGLRPGAVVGAVMIGAFAATMVSGRMASPQKFSLQWMPASGGSRWSDPGARRGVGGGDMTIAAKDHAESFGAVQSDVFLESTEPTLFDMFNDFIGEPKIRNKMERRQGLSAERVLEAHQKVAKSEKGGGSFSTDRKAPKEELRLEDSVQNAVIQWAGPDGIRLAMHRYDTFDGVTWSNQANHQREDLTRHEIDGGAWFFADGDQSLGDSRHGDGLSVNLLKVLRLDSPRLPTPMMTSGFHIKDVDRPDFFGIQADGSPFMPGREKVPAMTVINLASAAITEDELIAGLSPHDRLEASPRSLRAAVRHWTDGEDDVFANPSGWRPPVCDDGGVGRGPARFAITVGDRILRSTLGDRRRRGAHQRPTHRRPCLGRSAIAGWAVV